MTEEDYRMMVRQQFLDLKDLIQEMKSFQKESIDHVYEVIVRTDRKIDVQNKYLMMLVGVIIFLGSLIPFGAVWFNHELTK